MTKPYEQFMRMNDLTKVTKVNLQELLNPKENKTEDELTEDELTENAMREEGVILYESELKEVIYNKTTKVVEVRTKGGTFHGIQLITTAKYTSVADARISLACEEGEENQAIVDALGDYRVIRLREMQAERQRLKDEEYFRKMKEADRHREAEALKHAGSKRRRGK